MGRLPRIIVGLGLLALMLWLADPVAVLNAAASADFAWIALAVLLVIPDRALMAYRWVVLLRAIRSARNVPLGSVLRIFFVSTFVGTFLPSVGGDAVRAFGLSRHGVPSSDAAASVLMDRVMGVWSLFLIALPGLVLTDVARRDPGIMTAMTLTAAGCIAAAALLFNRHAAGALKQVLEIVPWPRARRAAERLLESVRRYADHQDVLINVTVSSLAVQAIRVMQSFCIGVGLGITVPWTMYFALIPIILIILLIPVTINGLGTSQLAFVWLFGEVGVPAATAFTLSVLAVSLGIVGNLPGGLIYAAGGAGRPRDVESRGAADPPLL
jgi:uncharacterized protein (TIRG00374 family)